MSQIPPGTKCEECENDELATLIWSAGGEAIPVCENCWDGYCDSLRDYIELDGTVVIDHSHGQNQHIISRTVSLQEIDAPHRPYVIVEIKKTRRSTIPYTWTALPGDFQNEQEAEATLDSLTTEKSFKNKHLGIRHKHAIQPDETSFWKARNARIRAISKSTPSEYLIERFDRLGTYQSTHIFEVEGDWRRTDVEINRSETITTIGTFENLIEALVAQSDATGIGEEMTFIYLSDYVHELIPLLRNDGQDFPNTSLEGWESYPFYSNSNLADIDNLEEALHEKFPESWTYTPTTASINENQLLSIAGPNMSGFMLLDTDSENLRPLITDALLTDWWMSSGFGPITWDGSTTIGFSGPNVLVTDVTGDRQNDFTIQPISTPNDVLEELADYIINNTNVAEAFLLNAIGMTDLSNGPYFDYRDAKYHDEENHQEVLVSLNEVQKKELISRVEDSSEHLKEVANALRNSKTRLGKRIYKLLPQMQEGEISTYEMLDVLRGEDG